jgi:hypothetical protein
MPLTPYAGRGTAGRLPPTRTGTVVSRACRGRRPAIRGRRLPSVVWSAAGVRLVPSRGAAGCRSNRGRWGAPRVPGGFAGCLPRSPARRRPCTAARPWPGWRRPPEPRRPSDPPGSTPTPAGSAGSAPAAPARGEPRNRRGAAPRPPCRPRRVPRRGTRSGRPSKPGWPPSSPRSATPASGGRSNGSRPGITCAGCGTWPAREHSPTGRSITPSRTSPSPPGSSPGSPTAAGP